MTGVMRNLYDIQTASEREQLAMAAVVSYDDDAREAR